MQTDTEARIRANTHAMVAALRDGTLSAWLHQTEDSIKSSKTDKGPRMAVKNATLLVRFAAQQDIEHPLVQSYMSGSSGPNADNDFNSLKTIAGAIVMKHATLFTDTVNGKEKERVDFDTTTATVIEEAVAWLSPDEDDTPTTTTDEGIDFGHSSEPAVDFGDLADPPEDYDDDDNDDEEDTLTVRSVVFDSLDNATLAVIQSVTDEDIEQAIAWLYNVNAGGMGYRMTLSDGAKQVNPSTFVGKNGNGPKTWGQWGQVSSAVADILRIAPKRKVKRDNKTFNRGWFAELVSGNNDAVWKRILMKMFAAVVLKSGRNFYNRRLAWSVSDNFAAEVRGLIGVNTELMESAPIGTVHDAGSWMWPVVKNDWSPNRTNKVANTDIDNMSLSDLMNL